MKYYSLKNILEKDAQYNLIIGERSNGKTYAALKHGLEEYFANGAKIALLRRWREDFRGKRGESLFLPLIENGEIERISKGKYNSIYYYAGRWYMSNVDEAGNRDRDEIPFCWSFALTEMEHDKSTSYPDVRTIIFDEFLTRRGYLPDEFVLFMNTLSTIIRQRKDVKIFMLGNTVNKYCPYFSEMGLHHVSDMKPGDIDVYSYGNSDLKVAVEFSDSTKGKDSNLYFAFDNPRLKMITSGVWEVDIYPHCPRKFKPRDIQFIYFIKFDKSLLQCEIVLLDDCTFTFVHEKTTPLQDETEDLIFSPEYSPLPNHRRNILKPQDRAGEYIAQFFRDSRVFYQSNEVGEVMRNYLQFCKTGG